VAVVADRSSRRYCGTAQSDSIDDELTPAKIRELRRRTADLDDVARHLLVPTDGATARAVLQRIWRCLRDERPRRVRRCSSDSKAALAVNALLEDLIRILRGKSRRGQRRPRPHAGDYAIW